jgi:2-amino-4-hydroxy-6-hydroxymethyldihydropteridine diphosphokinase
MVKLNDALPAWAIVTDKRRAHIARVVKLIDRWSSAMKLGDAERRAWHDSALWHDALRDAPETLLRTLTGDSTSDASLLHGPAAATQLAADGERRQSVLAAVRSHTTGAVDWDATGQALYMADFLEPGRPFAQSERAHLASRVAADFAGTFRRVVRLRLERTLHKGNELLPQTVALWNSIR